LKKVEGDQSNSERTKLRRALKTEIAEKMPDLKSGGKRGLTQAGNSSKLSARAAGRGVRLPENLTATAYQRATILPTFRQSGNDKKKKQ
jgi:hypothetical protein